jgi:hypothetical protein
MSRRNAGSVQRWSALSVLAVCALILQSFFVLADARHAVVGKAGILCAGVVDDAGSTEGPQRHHHQFDCVAHCVACCASLAVLIPEKPEFAGYRTHAIKFGETASTAGRVPVAFYFSARGPPQILWA